MGTFGSETKSLVKDLEILAKGETKPHVRLVMLYSILHIDPTNKSAVAGLAELVRLGDPVVSSLAVAYLGNCEALAAPHVPSVLEALQHADSSVRRGAADALGQIRVGSEDVIRALEDSTKDEDRLVRVFAIQSLGELGTAAHKARGTIQAAINSEDSLTRRTAERALRQINKAFQGSE
jgi:HEAT repeat protein